MLRVVIWGRDTDRPRTFDDEPFYFDLTNLYKLEDVENAYELALIEAKTSRWGAIDFKI